MNFLKDKVTIRTLQFTILSLIGNSFMAFLVYKLMVKEHPNFTSVNLTLLAIVIALITVIESIVFWSNQRNIFERQKLFRESLKKILKDDKAKRIVLDKDDPFYDLANAINLINSHNRHQVHEIVNQKNELRAIMDNLPVGILVINRHRELQISNHYARKQFNITDLNVPHPYSMDLQNSEVSKLIEQSFESHQTSFGHIQFDDQHTYEVSVVYSPKAHHRFEIVVLLYDISEEMRAKQVEEDFINNASHELRTPITSIGGFAETLLNGAKDDPETLDQFLTIIKDESGKLTQLTEDILTMSRIPKNEKKWEEVPLVETINQNIQILAKQIEQRHLQINMNIKNDQEVNVIKKDFYQIVKNLLSNAISYNIDGGQIIFDYAEDTKGWSLTVRDTGEGIPNDQINRIFERFYRVDGVRSTEPIGGTGLGLAIVKEAVEDMNGKISVKSILNTGTEITIRFKK
ncbi:sensor histidine kinase [Pediococcus claussenii]|uniref:histidine kinase n=1 Tax=Pediococcus claussenii (strain ATCC BAA-344 / DSM 14800 / JCM 18046 / KCTC 3811 / LMG 21948 / P06) TaxID=701521 RepID=G8PC05_PEDCP|nr:ATP-binding protein [Pediococcus claussenii]AEV94824.1 Phosphate regulon sensor histidine kinase protein PhoR [Pediococcus claussenii ATCC BAA-344]ANZ70021.1 two-component sensor histidine kinase [Pediococcus claussenii]ANZ71836.1 two-component sensor histidine kinase [Pediococcus claussenii]